MPKGGPGKPKSSEHRAKITEANRKKARDPIFCKKLSDSLKGKIVSEETKKRQSEKKMGTHRSLESRLKQSNTLKGTKRGPMSEIGKKNISISHIGLKRSEETKKRQGTTQRRLWQDPTHRQKMIESRKDYVMSEITKKRIGDANRRKANDPIICKKISLATKGKKRSQEIRQKFYGQGNPAWKGGITPLYNLIRGSLRYAEWRTTIYERDEYCDWFSGLSGSGNLCVHHIVPFNKLLMNYDIKSVEQAISCGALWNTNNGVTMFELSHIAYHSMWGNDTHPIH